MPKTNWVNIVHHQIHSNIYVDKFRYFLTNRCLMTHRPNSVGMNPLFAPPSLNTMRAMREWGRMRQPRTHAKISLEYYRHFPNSCLSKQVSTRIWTRYNDLDLLYMIYETVGTTDELLLLILNIFSRTKGWIEIGLGWGGGHHRGGLSTNPVSELQKLW